MWKEEILYNAELIGRSFNNQRVFEVIQSNNPEYENPIIYLPLREFCDTRILRPLELYGADRVPELLSEPLPGVRDIISIIDETHTLALVIGLRETGIPYLGRTPTSERSFRRPSGGAVFIRNFHGSGLDIIHRPSVQREMQRYLDPGLMRRIIVDDPDIADDRYIGIRLDHIRTIFNVYLRQQFDTLLVDLNLGSMMRDVRLFWRALTFGGQGGSPWESSSAGGRISLKTLMIDLLRIEPNRVKDLRNRVQVENLVNQITDRVVLRKIARHPTLQSRRHASGTDDITGWRELAINEIENGLSTPRYFQAIKAASITEGILCCRSWPTG